MLSFAWISGTKNHLKDDKSTPLCRGAPPSHTAGTAARLNKYAVERCLVWRHGGVKRIDWVQSLSLDLVHRQQRMPGARVIIEKKYYLHRLTASANKIKLR